MLGRAVSNNVAPRHGQGTLGVGAQPLLEGAPAGTSLGEGREPCSRREARRASGLGLGLGLGLGHEPNVLPFRDIRLVSITRM
jgi:hypothetical protein